MKKKRLVFLAIWILSLVGISFYGGPVTYGFFIVATFLPIVSFAYLFAVYFFFKIYQHIETKYPVSNKKVPYYFTLQNENHFGFVNIKVSYFSDFSVIEGLDENTKYALIPKTGIKKETNLICKYRGEYEVGIDRVRIEDFFGIFSFSYKNPETMHAVVKPNLIHLDEIKNADIENVSAKDTFINAQNKDVMVRDYVAGDDIRHINWKLSAREQNLKVHKMISEEQQGIGLIIDTGRYTKDIKEYLPREDKILATALAFSLYLAGRNIEHSIYWLTSSLNEYSVGNHGSFDAFYEEMSSLYFDEKYTAEALFAAVLKKNDIFSKKTVAFVLQEWSSEAETMAAMLNEQEISVTAYVLTGKSREIEMVKNLSGTKIVPIDIDDELTEVI